jgi:hypothetical protein
MLIAAQRVERGGHSAHDTGRKRQKCGTRPHAPVDVKCHPEGQIDWNPGSQHSDDDSRGDQRQSCPEARKDQHFGHALLG